MNHSENLTPWIEKLQLMSESKSFLNKEFLTWIWYFAEKNTGTIRFSPPKSLDFGGQKPPTDFYLWIDDKIILEATQRGSQNTVQHSLKGGDPSKSPEACLALLGGKIVKEIKIGIKILPFGDFTATLNGADLNPRSLTLPKATDESGENPQDPFIFRINAARLFIAALDHLVSVFIAERMRDDFETEVIPKLSSWIQKKHQNKDQPNNQVVIH